MEPSLLLALVIVLAAAVLALAVLRPSRVTIHDYERGLLFDRGRLKRELGAGVHWILRLFQSLQVIDTRSRVLAIAGQEVLSADNVSVKLSTAIRLRVAEPAKAVAAAQSFTEVIYLEAQLILRDLVSSLPIDDLLQKREELAGRLRERLEPRAAPLGLTLETVGIKDVMFPGGLKQIFAQVVEARKGAQAALERARGETATLRNLANAAKLLEGNPALVTLKTLQTASEGRHTLVLGMAQTPVLPLPETNGAGKPPLPAPDEGEAPA